MKAFLPGVALAASAPGSAMAQACESKAVGSDGKPLVEAARDGFMKRSQAGA